MITVTKTYLPDFSKYTEILKRAWDNNWITNRGELLLELEDVLKKYLDISNIIITTNGTLPIQIAIKALELKGEIITTPFSYVATTSSIIWEGCKPVFVDIDSEYLTIDENKIEKAITNKTTAILATHVFGNPCNVDKIKLIADKYNLKVIYDAAHCFGVKYKGKSIFNYGDVSTCSFHATKIFHSGEGGCMITNDDALHHKLFYHHNFGHNGAEAYFGLGINAKMSEIQAALGLAVFNDLDLIFNNRKNIYDKYKTLLDNKSIQHLKFREGTKTNYHYFPIILKSEQILIEVIKDLNKESIFPRRYFFPSLNTLNYVDYTRCEISESVSKRIICLPFYHELTENEIVKISEIILKKVC